MPSLIQAVGTSAYLPLTLGEHTKAARDALGKPQATSSRPRSRRPALPSAAVANAGHPERRRTHRRHRPSIQAGDPRPAANRRGQGPLTLQLSAWYLVDTSEASTAPVNWRLTLASTKMNLVSYWHDGQHQRSQFSNNRCHPIPSSRILRGRHKTPHRFGPHMLSSMMKRLAAATFSAVVPLALFVGPANANTDVAETPTTGQSRGI